MILLKLSGLMELTLGRVHGSRGRVLLVGATAGELLLIHIGRSGRSTRDSDSSSGCGGGIGDGGIRFTQSVKLGVRII
jgi:hypothetical protein